MTKIVGLSEHRIVQGLHKIRGFLVAPTPTPQILILGEQRELPGDCTN